LGAILNLGHGLGGFTERNRQDAGRQRIKRAGMACLGRGQEPAHLAHRLGGGEVIRLVEHNPAGDGALSGFFLFGHGQSWLSPSASSSSRSRRTRSERSSESMRLASSNVSSTKKRI